MNDPEAAGDPRGKRAFPRIAQAIGLVIAKTVLVIAFSIPAWILTPDESTIEQVANLLASALAFGVLIWWGFRRAGLALRDLSSHKPHLVKRALAIVLMVAGTLCLAILASFALQSVWPKPDGMKAPVAQRFGGSLLLTFVATMIVAPVTEEFFYRGLILRGFLRNYSRRKAIVVSALLFALGHLNLWQFPVALLLGLVLGWWMAVSGSLLTCVLAHALANSPHVVFPLLGRIVGPAPSPTDPVSGLAWTEVLSCGLVGVGLLAIGGWLARRATNRGAD